MQLDIGTARNWKVISEADARTFLEKVYAFLRMMPEHLNIAEVTLSPQWTVSGGHFQVCGVEGSITFGAHEIRFAHGSIPARNEIRALHKKGREGFYCPSVGRRYTWKGPEFYSRMFSILRTTLTEDLNDPECGTDTEREMMKKLITAPGITHAPLLEKGKPISD